MRRAGALALFLLASSLLAATGEEERPFRVHGTLVAEYPFTDHDSISFEGPVTLRRRLDSTGHYSVDGLRRGRYLIRLARRGQAYSFERELQGAIRPDLTLETFATLLAVVDSETGEALQVRMTLEKTGGPPPAFGIDRLTGGHGPGGAFSQLWGVPRGRYRLTLSGANYYTRTFELSISEDLARLDEVRLERKPVEYRCPETVSRTATASDRDRAVLLAALAHFASRFPERWDSSRALPRFPFELHMLVDDRTLVAPLDEIYPSEAEDEISADDVIGPRQRALVKMIDTPLFRDFEKKAGTAASIELLSPPPGFRLVCAQEPPHGPCECVAFSL